MIIAGAKHNAPTKGARSAGVKHSSTTKGVRSAGVKHSARTEWEEGEEHRQDERRIEAQRQDRQYKRKEAEETHERVMKAAKQGHIPYALHLLGLNYDTSNPSGQIGPVRQEQRQERQERRRTLLEQMTRQKASALQTMAPWPPPPSINGTRN